MNTSKNFISQFSTTINNENAISYPNIKNYENPELIEGGGLGVPKDGDFFSLTEDNINYDRNIFFYIEKDNKTNTNMQENLSDENFSKHFFSVFDKNNVEDEKIDQNKNKTTEINPKSDGKNNSLKKIKVKSQNEVIKKKKRINSKSTSPKNLNKKKKRDNFFKINNISFKMGNNFQRTRVIRKSNAKFKIIRNFIQESIPLWVHGKKISKMERINRDYIIKDYKNPIYVYEKISFFLKKKEMKNKEIIIDDTSNNNIIKIKLEFNLKEAFLCFASQKFRQEILSEVLKRLKISNENIDSTKFFEEFNYKENYKNTLANGIKDYENINKAFSELIEEFQSSKEEKINEK